MVEQRSLDGTTRLVAHWAHAHPPVRNINQEFQTSFSPLERMALAVTRRVGTPGFFLLIASWTILWLGWNLIGPAGARFDPAPAFVLWLFISNLIQLLLMPLLLVGQNLLNRHAELRADADFEVNQKAETEVEAILLHLEHQAASIEHQEELSLRILRRLEALTAADPGAAASEPGTA
ncbi:MAG: DUF1003 domain-containing protein [Chloroflexi bacterium]|nr:DUF1003 domain-containing protein [Chloroflexota bacterium]